MHFDPYQCEFAYHDSKRATNNHSHVISMGGSQCFAIVHFNDSLQ